VDVLPVIQPYIKTAIPPTYLAVPIAILIIWAWGYGGSRIVQIDENVPDTHLDPYTWNCGYRGSSVIATLEDDGTLIVSGTGAIRNFRRSDKVFPPWHDFKGSITNVIIEDGVTTVGEEAFWGLTALKSVTIGESVTKIGRRAFENCTGLTSVTIGEEVTKIEAWAFDSCISLTSVAIPRSVKSIDELVFIGCDRLTSINVAADNDIYSSEDGVLYNKNKTLLIKYPQNRQGVYIIPPSVTKIEEGAFWGRRIALTSIAVAEGNTRYSAADGVLFNKSKTILEQYPRGRVGAYKIPNGVTSIEDRAFASCYGLTSVAIPNSIAYIGKRAFIACTSLTSITIPNSVTRIRKLAFAFCTGLTSITISNSVTRIGDQAFYGCTGLTYVTIPESVIEIGHDVFSRCVGLTSVIILNPDPPRTLGAFTSRACLYVPQSGLTAYHAADGWEDFECIKAIAVEDD
jgi:hypothetical protein